jgi:hypothetical protein
MLLHRLLVNYLSLIKMCIIEYDKNLWQVYGKSYKVDVRLFFMILAVRIAFWVYLLIKIENFASYT